MKTLFSKLLLPGVSIIIFVVTSGCTRFSHQTSPARPVVHETSPASVPKEHDSSRVRPQILSQNSPVRSLAIEREIQRIEPPSSEALPGPNVTRPAETNLARSLEEHLLQIALALEAQKTAPQTQYQNWDDTFSLSLVALIAIILFFPAATPLAGRILASLVDQIPALAGPAGVVSVRAFDALVRAVERSKSTARLENASNTERSLDQLLSNLSREMDRSHKRLVSVRKRALAKSSTRHHD